VRFIDTLNDDFFVIFRGKVAKAPGTRKVPVGLFFVQELQATSFSQRVLAT
jgi:hypothetical protein